MVVLALSILSSSIIFVIFKLFQAYKIDTFQAIVFNYFTACTIGLFLFRTELNADSLVHLDWLPPLLMCSVLFISLFLIMGLSSQHNGVSSTSIAVKMSMAFSLVLMILWHGENLSGLKLLGICLAFLGVLLISLKKGSTNKSRAIWMLPVLFFGSGSLDFVLNYAQNHSLNYMSSSIFSALGLGLAGIIGALILLFKIFRKKTKIEFKNIVAGIILGVPNYFSIYLLLRSYESTALDDSSVLAITNVGVVLSSSLIGFALFKEEATVIKLLGLLASITAIVSLYLAQ